MNDKFKTFLKGWVVNTIAVLVAAYLVKGIHYEKPMDLFVATLLLGFLNAFVRPLLMLLSLPLLMLSLGLFMLVINALLLLTVGWLMNGQFHVDGFWSAFWGALVIGIVNILLGGLKASGSVKVNMNRGNKPPPPPKNPGGSGPVIDV